MNSILSNLALKNYPDLFIHAAKIENGLIEQKVGKTIVTDVPDSEIPEGMKVKNGYRYYQNVEVIAQDDYNMKTPYLTKFGWKQEINENVSELIPKVGSGIHQ